MGSTRLFRHLAFVGAMACGPAASIAQVVITAQVAPPPLPVYVQPVVPGDGYLWTPGYWAYGPDGYEWVPGAWVRPPRVGYYWTPPYWGFAEGFYRFHRGYWGPRVGYYGGIDYGYGYGGSGFVGGRWQGGRFAYNRAVSNVNVDVVRNTYVENVSRTVGTSRPSFAGGPGGVHPRPAPGEVRAFQDHRTAVGANPPRHFDGGPPERPHERPHGGPGAGHSRGRDAGPREGHRQDRPHGPEHERR